MQVSFYFSHQGHALVTLYVQIFMLWLVKICQVSSCGKFMQHLETRSLWQLKLTVFCVNLACDVFNCLFPLNVQTEVQLLSRVICYSWIVCLLGFWSRNTSLVKVGNPISDGIVFVLGVDKTRNMEHPGTWKNNNNFHEKKKKILIKINNNFKITKNRNRKK